VTSARVTTQFRFAVLVDERAQFTIAHSKLFSSHTSHRITSQSFAFLGNFVSQISAIRQFGLFMGLLVIFNYA
jgi:hypothetical protein